MTKITKTGNILFLLHSSFSELPIKFRELVCKECGWSMPTFYRKMRAQDKFIPALSNAEKEAVLRIAEFVVQELRVHLDK